MCLTGGLCGTEHKGTCQLRIPSSSRIMKSYNRQSRIKMFLLQVSSTDRYNITELKWATERRIAINTTVTTYLSESFKTEKVIERSYSYYMLLILFPKPECQLLMDFNLILVV